jgi:hypothetical protein
MSGFVVVLRGRRCSLVSSVGATLSGSIFHICLYRGRRCALPPATIVDGLRPSRLVLRLRELEHLIFIVARLRHQVRTFHQ